MKKNYKKNIMGAVAFVMFLVAGLLLITEALQQTPSLFIMIGGAVLCLVGGIVSILCIPVFCFVWGILEATICFVFSSRPMLTLEMAIIGANLLLALGSVPAVICQSKKENPSSRNDLYPRKWK